MAVFRAWEYQNRVGHVQIININAHELDIRVVGGQIEHITGKCTSIHTTSQMGLLTSPELRPGTHPIG